LAGKQVFVRDATGLVKTFGSTDLILISTTLVFGLGTSPLELQYFYGFNPGADLGLTLLVACVPFIFLMLVYWGIGVIMPRSGSDYVWVSRSFHPSVGFSWSLIYMFSVFIVGYVGTVLAYSYSFSIALTIGGLLYNMPALTNLGNYLSGSVGSFWLALVFTLIFALFGLLGSRLIKAFLYVTWGMTIVGIALMWWLLASTTPAAFAAKWDSVLGSYGTYQGLFAAATKAGFTNPVGGWSALVVALPIASLFLLGGNYGGNIILGEVKNVKKAVPLALFLSLFFGIIFWSVSGWLTLNAVGSKWLYGISYTWGVQPNSYTLPFPPSQPLLLGLIAYPNAALLVVMFVTYLLGGVQGLFAYFWVPSRYLFAWAFDRVIPTKFADVNDRFHTPHVAVGSLTGLAVIMLVLYAFTSWPTVMTIGIVLWSVAYVVPGLAAAAFPYVMKETFDLAPAFMRKKLAGVPVLTYLGALCAVSFAYIGYVAATDPLISSPTAVGAGIAVAIIAFGFAVYFISAQYHKRAGLDIRMAFKTIPPE